MASRAREFSRANPSTDPSHQAVVVRLDEGLARAETLGIQQRNGVSDRQAAVARRNQLRDKIEFSLIVPLVKIGRLAAQEGPELLGKFRINRTSSTHKAFLINAKSMLAAATAAKDLMARHGLAAALLDDLGKALDSFEAEGDAINLSRRAHIGATADLTEVAAHLIDLVNALDGFNRYRYQQDPEQLAVWTAARSVVGHSARKSTTTPPPSAPSDGTTRAA